MWLPGSRQLGLSGLGTLDVAVGAPADAQPPPPGVFASRPAGGDAVQMVGCSDWGVEVMIDLNIAAELRIWMAQQSFLPHRQLERCCRP